jgi:hypothetical protein
MVDMNWEESGRIGKNREESGRIRENQEESGRIRENREESGRIGKNQGESGRIGKFNESWCENEGGIEMATKSQSYFKACGQASLDY